MITARTVARVEHWKYAHSGERLLALQMDAAIAPGSSGGPVVENGRLVGVAMQGFSGARRCRAEVAGGTMVPGSGLGEPSVKIESLSMDERLDLLERLWDSLSDPPAEIPVTLAQQAELDRRSEALDRDVAKGRPLGVPWDEVVRQLRARR